MEALEKELHVQGSLRQRVYGEYRELMAARSATRAFSPKARQSILSLDRKVFGLMRHDEASGQRVCALHNLSGEEVQITQASLGGEETPFDRLVHSTCRDRIDLRNGALVLHPFETLWVGDHSLE